VNTSSPANASNGSIKIRPKTLLMNDYLNNTCVNDNHSY
jgi:hypothetical protein